jgi:hypothetical protein
MEQWFWTIVCVLMMAWYIIVTIVVAFFGGGDIFSMIKKMKRDN